MLGADDADTAGGVQERDGVVMLIEDLSGVQGPRKQKMTTGFFSADARANGEVKCRTLCKLCPVFLPHKSREATDLLALTGTSRASADSRARGVRRAALVHACPPPAAAMWSL